MKVESLFFLALAAVLVVFGGVYGVWSGDPVGTTCLILSAALCAMIGGYFANIARRIDARPEDRKDSEIADAAGEVGFFSPFSYWPISVAAAAGTVSLALAFQAWWLVALGAIAIIMTAAGFLFEYYVGQKSY